MLLTNGTLFICNECISLCKMVLDEEGKNRAGKWCLSQWEGCILSRGQYFLWWC